MIKLNQNYLVIFLILSIQIGINAQNSKATNSETYKTSKDSLLQQKDKLSQERIKLQNQIDSLKASSTNLDDKISSTLEEINGLYANKFGKANANRIMNKQVWKGMTDKMLRASWGKPDKIDKNVEKWGVFTQWYYGDVTFFFRDSKLTDWEEKK